MKSLLLGALTLPLVACYAGERRDTGECPAGEACSDLTPRGLDFVGSSLTGEILWSGPRATAIGGTQAVALEYDRGDGVDVALDLAYTADDDGGLGVRVDATSGSQVVVRGVASRKNYLRILDSDGLLMDRKELAGAALSRMELVSNDYEAVPADTLIAFAAGQRELGVALWGEVQESSGKQLQRIVDTSMTLSLPGSERTAWDRLRVDLGVGTHILGVTAGDKPTNTLDVVVVDHADSVALIGPAPATIATNASESLCFTAKAASRHVVGLTWTFVVDGETHVQGTNDISRNCISVRTTKTTGSVSIQASAGGQSTAMALTIGATARVQQDATPDAGIIRPLPTAIPTAGDRKAL